MMVKSDSSLRSYNIYLINLIRNTRIKLLIENKNECLSL